jgi:hypothetical protein
MFEKNYTSEKSYVLQKLIISSSNGEGINIYPQMIELSIFEDIYNCTISGHILMSDSQDLFNRIPLSGFEFITITVGKPGSSREIIFDKIFRIYKMTGGEVKAATTSNQTYMLHFCSEENVISASRRISKSYRGKRTSDIVRDILVNQLAVSSKKLLSQNIESSAGLHDIIIPYMNPLAAITWLAARTLSSGQKSSGANFMFYENTQGYNFKSLETLFQQKTKAKYSYKAKNIDFVDDTSVSEIQDVIKYEFMNTFDILSGINSGMFSSVLKGVDLTRLQVNDSVMNYNDFFNNSSHIEKKNPYQFQNEYEDRLKNKVYQNYYSLMRMYPTNRNHDINSNISSKQPSIKQNLVENWLLQRVTQISQLNYFKLKLVIPGDTFISVGDVIEFNLPLVSVKNAGEANINPFYSGRYLITAIRHKMDFQSYEMIVEATRDCLSARYPDAKNSDDTIKEIKKL